MRKLFALLMVAGMFTFVACEQKQETSEAQTEGADTTTTVAPEETAPVDTAATTAPATTDTTATTAPATGQEQMKH